MPSIHSLLPDPEILLALEPEELAGYILEYLNSLSDRERAQLNRYNFSLAHTVADYPQPHRTDIANALMEAWVWLEHEGLIAPKPGEQGEWVFITRRGRRLKNHIDVQAYHKSNILPHKMLHPVIAQAVWASFIRGDYEVAIFQAFKEIEIAVRAAGKFDSTDVGVDLMRKAFDKERGPLADMSLPVAEREAMAHLFAGAIGCYKNPSSHRRVVLDEPGQVAEIIMFASSLLRIVDERSGTVGLEIHISRPTKI